MIDYQILEAFNSTNSRLREILTAVPPNNNNIPRGESKKDKEARIEREQQAARDVITREKLRRRIQSRIEAGITQGLRNWKKFAAVDLAWDTSTISDQSLPLMLFAQGKINVERVVNLLGGPAEACKTGFVKAGKEQGQYEVDLPRFVQTEVNLVRSIITRRHGAQKVKFGELWPYYKYEPRSTGLVAKCRADVLSQRMDQMADQYGYREHESQVMLDGFLYAQQLDVVESKWNVEKQMRKTDVSAKVEKTADGGVSGVETDITKEGLGWINPHPSRSFWDNAYPLATLNTDTGCSYFGFWDVFRFSHIDDNPFYFNKDRVGWTGRFWGPNGIYQQYQSYFTHYLYSIIPPLAGEVDPSAANDRKTNVATYNTLKTDASVLVANYYERLVPKDWGIGEYPWPVWVRFVVTQDSTAVFAEILPSTPAAVLLMNCRDSRQMNLSMGMNLLGYQQQMTNLLTHLMLLCQVELFKAIGINKDLFEEPELDRIKAQLKGRNWASEPVIYAASFSRLEQDHGIKAQDAIAIAETHQGASISSIFEAMLKLVQMVEKLEALSQNEQGQPAPHEITATESQEISNTTSSVYGSISNDIDSYRAAKKRICYEALVACHEGNITCPVKDRYTAKTIQAAGFQIKQGEDEDYRGDVKRTTVIGSRMTLMHDYIFTTRDGAERPVNTQSANTLVQLISQVLSNPTVAQACGKSKIFELFNEVFRLSGAGVDLNLELKEGESNDLGPDEMAQMKQTVEQLTQMMQQLGGHVQQNSKDLADQEQMNADQQEAIKHLSALADQVKTLAQDRAQEKVQKNGVQTKLIESLSYKDAPPAIRRQLEAQAGFTPASQEEHNAEVGALKEAAKPKPATNGAAKK